MPSTSRAARSAARVSARRADSREREEMASLMRIVMNRWGPIFRGRRRAISVAAVDLGFPVERQVEGIGLLDPDRIKQVALTQNHGAYAHQFK